MEKLEKETFPVAGGNENGISDLVQKNLKYLSDQELDLNLRSLVRKENEVLGEILWHVREVEARRLYLEFSCGSLFEYLTKNLGYANGPAQRRIDAARLSKEVPSLIQDLKTGDLNLSQVALVQHCVRKRRQEHQKLEKAGLKSEALEKTEISSAAKAHLLESLRKKSIEESQLMVMKALDVKVQSAPKVIFQADESVRFEVTLTKKQWSKLERMRSLISHSLPDGSWDLVLENVADRVIGSKTKTRTPKSKPKTKTQLKTKTTAKPYQAEEGIEISPDLSRDRSQEGSGDLGRDEVHEENSQFAQKMSFEKSDKSEAAVHKSYYHRRKGLFRNHQSCQHVDASTKEKCTSTWKLQVEHLTPRWAGGKDEPENLTVLCAQHNRQKYREQAGIRLR